MTSIPIVSWFEALKESATPHWQSGFRFAVPARRPNLHTLYEQPDRLPEYVRGSYPAMRMLELLGPLEWDQFPERDFSHDWEPRPVAYAPFAAACLMRLEQGLVSMGALRQYLVDQPALIWLAGFPCPGAGKFAWVCDLAEGLPTARHLTRMLRTMPNSTLQFLLGSSVAAIHTEFLRAGALQTPLGDTVTLDTKHIPSASLRAGSGLGQAEQPQSLYQRRPL